MINNFWIWKAVGRIGWVLAKEEYQQKKAPEPSRISGMFLDTMEVVKDVFLLYCIWKGFEFMINILAAGSAAEAFTS